MMYALKQAVGLLASPMSIVLLLVCVAGVLRWRKRRLAASRLLAGAAMLAYLFCLRPVGHALIRPLESEFPPLSADSVPPGVRYVVVLGSSYDPQDGLPSTAALDSEGLARIVEGVRLWRLYGAARLLVSGGAPAGRPQPAQGYARLASELGVPQESLIISNRALDTAQEARDVREMLGKEPFLLVTSANHMPRAMWLMGRAGANAVAAPTGQWLRDHRGFSLRGLIPSSGGLRLTELAFHEYLGLAALALKFERAPDESR